MPPKKHLAVEGKAGPSRGSARGSSRGAPTVRASSSGASSRGASSRGASSSAASSRGASSSSGASSRGARGGRRPAGRGRRRAASYSGGNMGDTFLGKLTQNPGMMGEFMKFYDTLAKALDKRDKKKTAHRLGFGGDDDDDDDDEDNEDSDRLDDDSGEESPGDDLDGFTRRALTGMAAKMGGVSDLKLPDGTPLDFSSDDDDDDSDEDHEMEEVLFAMGNDTEESSGSEDEAEPASPAAARIKYVRFHDAEFAAAVAAATRIARLSLAKLMRTRKEDEMFGDVKKDKHIEAVLKALGNGTKDVAALHLEDAEWATCKIYSPMLVKLLASYRDNLRTLSLTNRLLLQPNNGKKKDCIWKVVSSMPHLEELRLTYVALSLHYFTYRGELRQDDGYGFATTTKAKQAPPVLPALKRIHLHLTPDWFERQFRAAIDDSSDYEDFEYESAGGGEREEEQEDFLVDLLASKGDAVTLLDMTCVQKTRMELEIVDLLAGLHNVLSIGLRVELLRVTKEMARLESAVVAFHHDPAPEDDAVAEAAAVIAAAPASWVGLKALTLHVPSEAASSMALFARAAPKRVRKVQASWNQVLTAAAGVCCSLKSLTLEGSGWGADALQQVLAKNPLLEEVVLDESAALEPRHLALLKDLAALKRVQLSPALRDAAEGTELAALVAQCQQQWAGRSVGVQWGKKTAGRA